MTNMLRTGATWLEQQRTAWMTEAVAYRRGATEVSVNATFCRTKYDVDDGLVVRIGAHSADFLILADDLGLVPAEGDVIVANGRKYEVMNLAGSGCWEWSDSYNVTRRIHTRDVGLATEGES